MAGGVVAFLAVHVAGATQGRFLHCSPPDAD